MPWGSRFDNKDTLNLVYHKNYAPYTLMFDDYNFKNAYDGKGFSTNKKLLQMIQKRTIVCFIKRFAIMII